VSWRRAYIGAASAASALARRGGVVSRRHRGSSISARRQTARIANISDIAAYQRRQTATNGNRRLARRLAARHRTDGAANSRRKRQHRALARRQTAS